MNLNISKDIDSYRRDFWKGLSIKHITGAAISMAIATGFVAITHKYLGTSLSVYISMMVSAPIGYVFFFKKDGMNILSYNRKLFGLNKGVVFLYESTERPLEEDKTKRKRESENNEKKNNNKRIK